MAELEHSPFRWALCGCCGWTILCPNCGNNCCNGGYGEVDGKTCGVCPHAHEFQDRHWKDGTAPPLPDDWAERQEQVRQGMIDSGVKFATDEDLASI